MRPNTRRHEAEPYSGIDDADSGAQRSLDGYSERPTAASCETSALPLNFDDVYRSHFGFVWRSLRALGVSTPHLPDAAQDVFLVVHRRLLEFESRSEIRTWLFAIVGHVAYNYRRAQRRKQAPLGPLDLADVSDAPDPSEHVAGVEAVQFLEDFLDGLDAGKRAVFALALIEQIPVAQVAAILQVPQNTVYSRIRAVRQALREAMLRHQEAET